MSEVHEAGLRIIVRSRVTKAPVDLEPHFRWHGDASTDGQAIEPGRVPDGAGDRGVQDRQGLEDATVVADAGMVSTGNQQALEDTRLSFILHAKIPDIPYQLKEWHEGHPDDPTPVRLVLTQPWPATQLEKARGKQDRVINYRYRADRARRPDSCHLSRIRSSR